MADPLSGTLWSRPETVAGFVASPANEELLDVAARELAHASQVTALDIGCGAGRNAIPLAAQGWRVLGTDLSWPMLEAALRRAREAPVPRPLRVALAPMQALPVRDASCRLVVAHGIWNLARSGTEFRLALREGARVAAPGAALFVFTFSRNTLPSTTEPVPGESFVFTEFSGRPQCFLTEAQLVDELAESGFAPDRSLPIRELNRPAPGQLITAGPPVIYQGLFRRR